MKKKDKVFGFVQSTLDGSEHIFNVESEDIPTKYSYKSHLSAILDQGQDPICVPCSISAYLNWKKNLETGSKKDNKVKYFEIYGIKTTEGEGMTFKEALHYLRHHGVSSKAGNLTIKEYAMVNSDFQLKNAILMNGPCVGALPVYNYGPDFWNKKAGDTILGYHAISICGYDAGGFIIRNSWGTSFANSGYTYISNADFKKFVEIWTIVE